MNRTAVIKRKTFETDISVELRLDESGAKIDTGIGFFDHMLNSLAKHSGFYMDISCKGDLVVDGHHTVEDVGIALGKAFADALGDRSGIARYGSFVIPMDEALCRCALDISGRPFLVYNAEMPQERCGEFDTCLAVEFFRAFAFNAGITLHLCCEYGDNAHHIIEALFKALAHSLRIACAQTGGGTLSTKGVL